MLADAECTPLIRGAAEPGGEPRSIGFHRISAPSSGSVRFVRGYAESCCNVLTRPQQAQTVSRARQMRLPCDT